jgi:hypothetical protein
MRASCYCHLPIWLDYIQPESYAKQHKICPRCYYLSKTPAVQVIICDSSMPVSPLCPCYDHMWMYQYMEMLAKYWHIIAGLMFTYMMDYMTWTRYTSPQALTSYKLPCKYWLHGVTPRVINVYITYLLWTNTGWVCSTQTLVCLACDRL